MVVILLMTQISTGNIS